MKTKRSRYHLEFTTPLKNSPIKGRYDKVMLEQDAYSLYCWHCITNPTSFVEFRKDKEEMQKWLDVLSRPGYSKTNAA